MFDIIFAKVFTVLLASGIITMIVSAVYGSEVGAYLGMTILVILLCAAVGFMAKVFIDKFNEIEKERDSE